MSAKIHIKSNSLELQFEGTESFIKEELLKLVKELTNFHPTLTPMSMNAPQIQATDVAISTIAARLSVKSGPELAIATAVKLIMVDGKETFTREELLAEMKSATAFYKETYSTNLHRALNKLVKENKLNALGGKKYTLTANQQAEFRIVLSQL